jgi:hypothetical protein
MLHFPCRVVVVMMQVLLLLLLLLLLLHAGAPCTARAILLAVLMLAMLLGIRCCNGVVGVWWVPLPHLKKGQVRTNSGPAVLWTSLRLSFCRHSKGGVHRKTVAVDNNHGFVVCRNVSCRDCSLLQQPHNQVWDMSCMLRCRDPRWQRGVWIAMVASICCTCSTMGGPTWSKNPALANLSKILTQMKAPAAASTAVAASGSPPARLAASGTAGTAAHTTCRGLRLVLHGCRLLCCRLVAAVLLLVGGYVPGRARR